MEFEMPDWLQVFVVVSMAGGVALLWGIMALLVKLVERPHPQYPESRVISQSVVVKADSDITTVLPTPLAATTCNHKWKKTTEQTLSVLHEQKYILVLECPDCGSLDKTVTTTSKIPPPLWKKEDCRHQWSEEKAVRLESAYEQLSQGDIKQLRDKNSGGIDPWMFKKTYLKVRVCNVCGDVNTVKASNYDIVAEGEE